MPPQPPPKSKTDLLRDRPAVQRKAARPPGQRATAANGFGAAVAQDIAVAHEALAISDRGAELNANHAGALQRTVGNRATGEVFRMAGAVQPATAHVRIAGAAAGAMLARRHEPQPMVLDTPMEVIEPVAATDIERKPMAEPPPPPPPPPADAGTGGDATGGSGGTSAGAPPTEPPPPPKTVQAKLTVGAADDPLEREADATAARVMRSTTPGALQRDADPATLRRAAVGMEGGDVDAGFEQNLQRSKSGGSKLPDGVRSKMETGFGASFDSVRLHTGEQSNTLNRSISAQAFTHGSDIFFDSGKYQPATTQGQTLLAHELTHVVQQGAALRPKRIQRKPGGGYQVTSMYLTAKSLIVSTSGGTFSYSASRSPNLPDGEYEISTSMGGNGVVQAQFIKVIKSTAGNNVVLDFTSFGAANPKDKSIPRLDEVFANPFSGVLKITNGKQAPMTFNEFGAGSGEGTGGAGGQDESGSGGEDKGMTAPPAGQIGGTPGADGKEKEAPKSDQDLQPHNLGEGGDGDGDASFTDPAFPSDIVGPERAPVGGETNYKMVLRFMENYQSLLVGVTNAMRVQYRIEVYNVTSQVRSMRAEADRNRAGLAPKEAGYSTPGDQSSSMVDIMSTGDTGGQSDPGNIVDQTSPLGTGGSNMPIGKLIPPKDKPGPNGTPAASTIADDAAQLDKSVRQGHLGGGKVVGRTDAAVHDFGRIKEQLGRDYDQSEREDGKYDSDEQAAIAMARNGLARGISGVARFTGAALVMAFDAMIMNTEWERSIPWENDGDFIIRAIAVPPTYTTKDGEERRRRPSVATKWVRVSSQSKIAERAVHDEKKAETDLDAALMDARKKLGDPSLSSANAEKLKTYIEDLEKRVGAQSNSVAQIRYMLEAKRKELAEIKRDKGDHPLLTRDVEKTIRALEVQLQLAEEREGALGTDTMRPKVSLVSEITGETYPLMLQMGFHTESDGSVVATLSDVSSKAGRLYSGKGPDREAAAWVAIRALSGHNEYGRGTMVARMPQNSGFKQLEDSMSNDPRDTQLIRNTLADLAKVLGVVAMVVPALSVPAMLVGAAESADKLMQMWQSGTLKYNQLDAFAELLNILTVATSGISAIGNLQVVVKADSILLKGVKGAGVVAGAVEQGISTFQIAFASAQFVAEFTDIRRKVATGEISNADARTRMAAALSGQMTNLMGGALALRGALQHADQRRAAKTEARIKQLEIEMALDAAHQQLAAQTQPPAGGAAPHAGDAPPASQAAPPTPAQVESATLPAKSPEIKQAEQAVQQQAKAPAPAPAKAGVPDVDATAHPAQPGGTAFLPPGTPTAAPDVPAKRVADPNDVTRQGNQAARTADPNQAPLHDINTGDGPTQPIFSGPNDVTQPGTGSAVHIPSPLEALGMAALKHGNDLAAGGKLPRGMTPDIYARRILSDAIEHRGVSSEASFNNRTMMMADLLGNPQSVMRDGLLKADPAAMTGFLKLHGNWKQAQEMLSKDGSPEMQQIGQNLKAWRDGIVKGLVEKFKLDMKGSLSSEAVSDYDLATTGDNAGQLMIDAEAHMANMFGMPWHKVSEMLRLNFYTEAGRLTQYEGSFAKLSGKEQAQVQNELVALTEQMSFAKMLHHAGDNPEAIARVREIAKRVKFDLDAPGVKELVDLAANPQESLKRRNELLLEIDQLKQRHDAAAADPARAKEAANLALEITKKQVEANFHTTEAYASPGAGRSVVGGINVKGPEAYESALGQLEMIEHHIKESGYDTVAAFREYMFAKYITRYIEPAKAAGVTGPMVSYFEHMAQYIYKQHRDALNKAAHLWSADRLNDMSSALPVTPDFLRSQFADWRQLVLNTLPQIKQNAMADPAAWAAPKRDKSARPAAGDSTVYKETPGVFSEAVLTLGPDAAGQVPPAPLKPNTSPNRAESGVIVNGKWESRRVSGEISERGAEGANKPTAEVFGTHEAPLRPQGTVDRTSAMSSAGFAGSVAGVQGFGVFRGRIVNSAGAIIEVAIKVGRKFDHRDPRHTGEQRDMTPAEQVRFDGEARFREQAFHQEVDAARIMGETGAGPKCYGVVDVGDPRARAFAMEVVKGSFYEFTENKAGMFSEAMIAQQKAEADAAAGAITHGTVRDLQIYGQKLLDSGWYYQGEVQGLIGQDGAYKPIDAGGLKPLPTIDDSLPPDVKAARRTEREEAIRSHWDNIDAERVSLLHARARVLQAKSEKAQSENPRSPEAKKLAQDATNAEKEAVNAQDAAFVPVDPKEKARYDVREMVRNLMSGTSDLAQPENPTPSPGARPADAAITKPEQVEHAPAFPGIVEGPARTGTEIPPHPVLGQPEAEYDRGHRNNAISDYDADTFGGSKYTVITLEKPVTVYRAGKFDPTKPLSKHLGRFFALSKPKSELQTRLDLAARVQYIGFEDNIVDMDSSFTVEIPAGTKVYVGRAGDQIAPFFGGTEQIFIPDAWTNPGIRVVERTEMVKWREWNAKNKSP